MVPEFEHVLASCFAALLLLEGCCPLLQFGVIEEEECLGIIHIAAIQALSQALQHFRTAVWLQGHVRKVVNNLRLVLHIVLLDFGEPRTLSFVKPHLLPNVLVQNLQWLCAMKVQQTSCQTKPWQFGAFSTQNDEAHASEIPKRGGEQCSSLP